MNKTNLTAILLAITSAACSFDARVIDEPNAEPASDPVYPRVSYNPNHGSVVAEVHYPNGFLLDARYSGVAPEGFEDLTPRVDVPVLRSWTIVNPDNYWVSIATDAPALSTFGLARPDSVYLTIDATVYIFCPDPSSVFAFWVACEG